MGYAHWLAYWAIPKANLVTARPAGPSSGRGCFASARRTRAVFVATAALFVLLQAAVCAGQIRKVRRVLILYELGRSSPAVRMLDKGIDSALESTPDQIELYREYFETTLFPDPATQKQVRDQFVQRYRDRKPDLILAVGPTPIQFLIDRHREAFSNVPIVFCGSAPAELSNPVLDSDFTGVWESFEPDKTMAAALRMQPDTEHVVVVGGMAAFDKYLEEIYKAHLKKYEQSLHISYLTDLDLPSLLERLRHLPEHTIVLYAHLSIDAKGAKYIGASQVGPMIVEAANAPVFGASDVNLGHGEVGGYLNSFEAEGNQAAQIALRVLKGEKPADIPIRQGANLYMFDWRALERWKLNQYSLPAGSILLFQPASWRVTAQHGLMAVLIVLSCVTLVAFLVSWWRLKIESERRHHLGGMLISAEEKERRRIASELHDDFSQRLALLALGLDNAAGALNENPEETQRRLHELFNSASEIGADLHTLSHRLHSSTLDSLGLVPGVKALCREFSTKHGIEIEFIHSGVPRSVNPDVGLCVFRIVQECLSNLRKHSRAVRGIVDLRCEGGRLSVKVSDDGVGLNSHALKTCSGLGFQSMEERASLLGGKLTIESRPRHGTRITAHIPLLGKPEAMQGGTAIRANAPTTSNATVSSPKAPALAREENFYTP